MMEHTPISWVWGSSPGSSHYFVYVDGQKAGEQAIAVVEELDKVKLIVERVNAHDALVKALEKVNAIALEMGERAIRIRPNLFLAPAVKAYASRFRRATKAALKLAEGGAI